MTARTIRVVHTITGLAVVNEDYRSDTHPAVNYIHESELERYRKVTEAAIEHVLIDIRTRPPSEHRSWLPSLEIYKSLVANGFITKEGEAIR